MSERDLIRNLHRESKNWRQKVKALSEAQGMVTGSALITAMISEVEIQGVYLERAVLSCDMAMGIACAQIGASEILNDPKENARDLFRHAAKTQKSLMPFVKSHSDFICGDFNFFDPGKIKEYMAEMEKVAPIMAEAEGLNEYCIDWRHSFVEKQNKLLATQ
jgi:hypothetical protein